MAIYVSLRYYHSIGVDRAHVEAYEYLYFVIVIIYLYDKMLSYTINICDKYKHYHNRSIYTRSSDGALTWWRHHVDKGLHWLREFRELSTCFPCSR